MCNLLSEEASVENFNKILHYLLKSIEEKKEQYKKNHTYNNFILIQNYIIFFMVLTLNLKKYPSFIKTVFKGECDFFHKLVNTLKDLSKKKRKTLLGIINNIFLEEYKDIYFRKDKDEELENIYISELNNFSSIESDFTSNYQKETYKKMFKILLDFTISYNNFFSNNSKITEEEKPTYKLCIAQSLIRVVFSKERTKYFDQEKFYEYKVIKRVIDKDMEETVQKFGDEYRTLFRKEDLCDDFIKYMFFIFGNTMMIESFVKPLKNMLKKKGINLDNEKNTNKEKNSNNDNKDKDITKEEFDILVSEMINKLQDTIPLVLKILLRLIYDSVKEHFTIEDDNYSPLYSSLIFNFIISPRIQMIYSINPLNCVFIRSLNRLLRNTCFNFKFNADDPLAEFNDIIEKNNKKMKNFIKEHILKIKIQEDVVKYSLKDLFTEKYIIYPKFLFYWDSKLLCATTEGGVDNIIDYMDITVGNS